jgi:hypothetical protein
MRTLGRLGAATLAALLALALAAPLASARCQVASAPGCPLMKGAAGSLCHRGGASMAPAMSCCQSRGTAAPPPNSTLQQAAPLLAVLPGAVRPIEVAGLAGSMPAPGAERIDPAADALHALGLFTLLAVFRN